MTVKLSGQELAGAVADIGVLVPIAVVLIVARARRVTAGRLATTLGAANLFAGGLAGMPLCHGAGGGRLSSLSSRGSVGSPFAQAYPAAPGSFGIPPFIVSCLLTQPVEPI
jgi:Molybdate transporter of MFS superfamily